MSRNEKFLIIDGSSLAYRAFYALPLLQNRRGEHTNAVYGFTTMLLSILEKEKPRYAAVVFDLAAPTFRHELYAEYKAHREETPSELGEQISRIKEVLHSFGIPVFEKEGYEADDIIGSLVRQCGASGVEILLLTGDNDLLQLVREGTRVALVRRGISDIKEYREDNLQEELGLTSEQLVDYRSLKGDPSDNIPGVPGIGEKTAKKLLREYGNLEAILESAEELGDRLQRNLSLYREQALLSRELSRIRSDMEIEFELDHCSYTPDYGELRGLFEDLEFKTLLDRLPRERVEVKEVSGETPLERVEEIRELKEGGSEGRISLRLELEPAYPSWKGKPRAVAFALEESRGYYFHPRVLTDGSWREMLRELCSGGEVQILGHDVKEALNFIRYRGHETVEPVFDSLLAAYLLDPGRSDFSISHLLKELLEEEIPHAGATPEGGKREGEELSGILALEARHLFRLREAMERRLSESSLLGLYEEVELPLTAVLSEMERRGVKIDRNKLKELSREIKERLERLAEEIIELAGEEFNLNSPRQLSCILFEKLKLPVVRKTKTGYSTDARVLEELAPHHQIVEKILYHRHLVKLEGTYLNGILQLVDPKTGKIYTTFNQTVTSTGRLSSSDPNLQNIPVRLEEGRRIREAFIPSVEEYLLLAADYSQIELRILAHLSGDPILLEAFHREEDIHTRTASEIFGISPSQVTPEMRSRTKAVNFGIVYGISDYGLSRDLKISRQEAARYIKSYMEDIVSRARKQGYVTTLFNRRRYLPEINSPRFNLRSFAERTARNTPIQGSAADIIKLAMLRVHSRLQEEGCRGRLLLQVHDELILEMPREEREEVARLVQEEMEQAVTLEVPIKVDLGWGENWYRLK